MSSAVIGEEKFLKGARVDLLEETTVRERQLGHGRLSDLKAIRSQSQKTCGTECLSIVAANLQRQDKLTTAVFHAETQEVRNDGSSFSVLQSVLPHRLFGFHQLFSRSTAF